ncbi:putative manganese-dependent inorganic diphosphatase [Floccifex sp.]|uniref:putative manganese-dependent inorganic diphosphatase n=1 Tax=Floccifex sp. TaxID=2815810 RepID=UPI003F0E1A53
MGKIYAIGHKKPDTDSIASSLAICELKVMSSIEVIAARLGTLNEETKFATRYFQVDAPILLSDARTLLKDIQMDEPAMISMHASCNDAFKEIVKTNNKTLYVIENKELKGIVSIGDLASLKLLNRKQLDVLLSKSSIEHISKDTKSDVIVKGKFDFTGRIVFLSSEDDEIEEHSIILCHSKHIQIALQKNPTMIIFIEKPGKDFETCIEIAKKRNITLLDSKMALEEIVLAIYYAFPVSLIMSKNVVCYMENDFVDETRESIVKTRFRSYPVVNENNHLVGSISRYHLFNYQPNQFILVDHSSLSQSIDHLEQGEIIEVIDHHHIGDIQTTKPIEYRNQKCGCTCSIIYQMYQERGYKPSKKIAGMMLSAIISDTLYFQSETTTSKDIENAYALASIAHVNIDEYANCLLKASVNLENVDIIEVIERDLKEYRFGKYCFAVGQTNYSDLKDIQPRLNEFKESIRLYQEKNQYDLMIMMFTNVKGEGTLFIYSGPQSFIMNSILENPFDTCSGFDEKIMSRKQQLIPMISKYMDL